MTRGITVSERAQRLRDLAASADNIAALAGVLDETIDRARRDLMAPAGAGRIEREADASEVTL